MTAKENAVSRVISCVQSFVLYSQKKTNKTKQNKKMFLIIIWNKKNYTLKDYTES